MTLHDMTSLKNAFSPEADEFSYRRENYAEPVLPITVKQPWLKYEMAHLVNRLSKAPEGKALVQGAIDAGYAFSFEPLVLSDMDGKCDGENGGEKVITLSYLNGLGKPNETALVFTLAHECAHALQLERMGGSFEWGTYTLPSEILATRMMEADANARAVDACYALEKQGDKGPVSYAKARHADMCNGYETGATKEECLTNAFTGWFKDTLMLSVYTTVYQANKVQGILQENMLSEYPYDKEYPAGKLAEKVCGGYLRTFPEDLKKEPYSTVDSDFKDWGKAFFKVREKLMNMQEDPSFSKLPTYTLSPEVKKSAGSLVSLPPSPFETKKEELLAFRQETAAQKIAVWKEEAKNKKACQEKEAQTKKTVPSRDRGHTH